MYMHVHACAHVSLCACVCAHMCVTAEKAELVSQSPAFKLPWISDSWH